MTTEKEFLIALASMVEWACNAGRNTAREVVYSSQRFPGVYDAIHLLVRHGVMTLDDDIPKAYYCTARFSKGHIYASINRQL